MINKYLKKKMKKTMLEIFDGHIASCNYNDPEKRDVRKHQEALENLGYFIFLDVLKDLKEQDMDDDAVEFTLCAFAEAFKEKTGSEFIIKGVAI